MSSLCNNPSFLWAWLTVPIGFGAGAGFAIYLARTAQLTRWDLASSPRAPIVQSIWMFVALAVFVVALPLFTAFSEVCDPDRWLPNSGLWVVGSLVGAAIALSGQWLAGWRYSKEPE